MRENNDEFDYKRYYSELYSEKKYSKEMEALDYPLIASTKISDFATFDKTKKEQQTQHPSLFFSFSIIFIIRNDS